MKRSVHYDALIVLSHLNNSHGMNLDKDEKVIHKRVGCEWFLVTDRLARSERDGASSVLHDNLFPALNSGPESSLMLLRSSSLEYQLDVKTLVSISGIILGKSW